MMGRLDIRLQGTCGTCNGTGKDPKKRTRKCPTCNGSGKKLVCQSCGEEMPCSGTDPNIFDQTYCRKGEF
jgi:DnaJ-class molecular chaperone